MTSKSGKKCQLTLAAATVALAVLSSAQTARAQFQGPSTGSTPYILPTASFVSTYSILTVDNTGAALDDSIGGYQLGGIPDGLGAFDNGNNTFTVLMNHEFGNTNGVARAHGGIGSYVSKWVINKNTFAVTSGSDLITSVFGWNTASQASNNSPSANVAFNRFCSADLAAPSAFSFNGLGTTERIFMHGEEGGNTGWQQATVVTGADAGKSYTLGKFNLSTNANAASLSGIGAWENSAANPFAQTKTIVASGNDGGTGIMNNAVSVYVGTKTNTGTDVDKAGLTNGVQKFISVAGNPTEITNTTTRTTGIASDTAFSLSATTSTTFSRPEDIAWNPANPQQLYFVTTDRLDQVSDGTGAQIGTTRLWRANFSDISNPDAGGTIELLLNGPTVGGKKVNMFDNLTVSADGHVFLQEDVGGAPHNGKIFEYDPSSGGLTMIGMHDASRFGDLTSAATSPFTNDEEASGIIDITALMAGSSLSLNVPGERWFLSSDQAHYTTGITAAQVEGGQLVAIHMVPEPGSIGLLVAGIGLFVGNRRRRV